MAQTEIKIIEGEHILKNLEIIKQHMPEIIRHVVNPHMVKFMRSFLQQSGMKKYPGRPSYPLDWETPKQEFYVKHVLKIRGYNRTGELMRSFDVRSNVNAGEASIVNTYDAAQYIIGDRQQRFHKQTGYRQMNSYEDDMLNKAERPISRAFESEIGAFLFRRNLL